MKKAILTALQRRAKYLVARFNPIVVAVTGSIGKTSTKQAIAYAMAHTFEVRTPEKNFNNEFGLPLTILGEKKSPGKNVWEWAKVLWRARHVSSYPQMLVLEYGADKPGDIAALCDIASPHVSVITGISPVHVANYPSLKALIDEKATLGVKTDPQGLVVLNATDPRVLALRSRMDAKVVTYGLTDDCDVYAKDIRLTTRRDKAFEPGEVFATTTATVFADGQGAELQLTNCVGQSSVLACLAAVAVARHYGVSLHDAVTRLNGLMQPAPGRLNPIPGIRGTLVLDDTYNAAPASVHAGLDALRLFTPGESTDRRVVALGKMAELGASAREEHRAVGVHVSQVADLFIAVGDEMRDAVDAAVGAGMDREHIEWFGSPVEAGRYLDKNIRAGDVILVKGSQSARMEKTVKDIMAEPLKSADLLVRQDAYWLKR